MTKPLLSSAFALPASSVESELVLGLSAMLDEVAEAAPESHRFLRYQWYAAALAAYGGHARTLIVRRGGAPVLAMPLVEAGPSLAGVLAVPGCYWPFRSFPATRDDGGSVHAAALDLLAGVARTVRIGPVYDDDPCVGPLLDAAGAAGWLLLNRRVAESHLLDMARLRAGGQWPRNSTLRKNRFHEKHLAGHGALDWRFLDADAWPAAFDLLGEVESRSWVMARTDGSDAKFVHNAHGTFWREAARDPALAAMFHAALLAVDGRPAAFSFDLDVGRLKYAIANSYDPVFAKHSPGKLLYWRNLVEALARGQEVVDWGAGDGGYKRVIGADEGPVIRDWLLVRPGWPRHLGRLVGRWWQRSGNQASADAN